MANCSASINNLDRKRDDFGHSMTVFDLCVEAFGTRFIINDTTNDLRFRLKQTVLLHILTIYYSLMYVFHVVFC